MIHVTGTNSALFTSSERDTERWLQPGRKPGWRPEWYAVPMDSFPGFAPGTTLTRSRDELTHDVARWIAGDIPADGTIPSTIPMSRDLSPAQVLSFSWAKLKKGGWSLGPEPVDPSLTPAVIAELMAADEIKKGPGGLGGQQRLVLLLRLASAPAEPASTPTAPIEAVF